MIRSEISFEVARPVGDVFAYLDDHERTPEWLERCVELRQTSSEPKTVGTRLHYVYREGSRRGEMDGEVTIYEKNARLQMHYTDSMFEITVDFRLAEIPPGTRVEHSVEITPRGLIPKLMSPLIRSSLKKQIVKDTGKLRRVLEARTPTTSRSAPM